jgi:hypothetical protein
MCAGPPSTKALLTPKKSVTFDNTNDGVKQYLSTLMTYVHQVFARPKACYIEQYLYNKKAWKISKIAKKARLNNTAKHTVDAQRYQKPLRKIFVNEFVRNKWTLTGRFNP